jgi:DNA mismatch repair protein MutS2
VKQTSAPLLEFEDLRELIGRYIGSPMGRLRLDRIEPSSNRVQIEAGLADADEAIAYLRSSAAPQPAQRGAAIRISFSGLPDLTHAAEKIRIEGASLEPKELFDLISLLDRAADARSILNAVAERFPRLGARGAAIADFRPLLSAIDGKVLPNGSIADTASVALNRLRREIERQKRDIQQSLERFLRAHRDDGMLQEEIVTIRNERFVVPVVTGQRRRIDGVIHGASSSGHTLFVEPLETIDLNNELVRLTEEEAREVHRILRELTARLRESGTEIRYAIDAMGELDLIFAKARFAREYDCSIPRFSPEALKDGVNERRLTLEQARHPLLADVLKKRGGQVVPFDVTLDAGCRTLLISGPNTGGKTVTLKTVGLISLMAQAALPVPCRSAELPLFEQVLADIGDAQSIQESLSTFSAHIARLREMALDVTPDSLVLLDEIGSATDPEEGGALGVALIEHFRSAGAFTLASTHLLALKIYGANTPTVLNASMGYDEASLAPTYRLQVGLPGKSAGLDIAARLGMPEDIMKRARATMSTHEADLSRLLADLHTRLESVERDQTELAAARRRLNAEEVQLKADLERREASRSRDFQQRTEELIARFEEQSRETIERLAETAERRKAEDLAQRKVARVRREFREQVEEALVDPSVPVPAAAARPKLEEGARVRVRGVRDIARVRRLLSADKVEIEAGFLKMQVSVDDIEQVLPDSAPAIAKPKLGANVTFRQGPQLNPVFQEINVIGERAEEAKDRVEQFLDQAVLATASRVRIVHGHGMGILKRAIGELLGSNPHVARFYPAGQNEGGSGATIVELRE